MNQRTVTIDTVDLGTVTIAEPAWCVGDHDFPPVPRRRLRDRIRGRRPVDPRLESSEIHHFGEPVTITVDGPNGTYGLLDMMLWQTPYPVPSDPRGTEVYIVVKVDDEHVDFDPVSIDTLSVSLMEAAGRVRLVARDFAGVINGGDQ